VATGLPAKDLERARLLGPVRVHGSLVPHSHTDGVGVVDIGSLPDTPTVCHGIEKRSVRMIEAFLDAHAGHLTLLSG
jgi:hypothetical protein